MNVDALFVAPKDVVHFTGGDTVVTRELARLLADDFSVGIACLADDSTRSEPLGAKIPVWRFPKKQATLPYLLSKSIRTRRSPVHARFASASLSSWLVQQPSRRLIFEHTYMAENAPPERQEHCYVNTHVSESMMAAGSGGVRRVLASWTARDEERCLRSARGVAVFDPVDVPGEIRELPSTHQIDLAFESQPRVPVEANGPVAVFLGDRTWLPNYLGSREAVRLWSAVRASVPAAELWLVGRGPLPPEVEGASGVSTVGFVRDLQALLRQARFMIAPIDLGGGVRVKLLEAAAIGLPFVGSEAAVGTVGSYLDVRSVSREGMVDESIRLLTDKRYARNAGSSLHDSNCRWRNADMSKRQLVSWLGL